MNKTSKEKEALLDVFASMVRPLMRVAFEFGISAGEIAGVVRRVYIQALEARLKEQKRPTTDARLALVAGLPKSDVSALRNALREGAPHSLRAGLSLDQLTYLLTVWHTHSSFSGAYGFAMDLDLQPTVGSPRRSFRELVAIACPGVDEDALLDELVAAGSVELIDANAVRCLSRAFVPSGADVTRIERMGRYLAAISANFAHNLLRAETEPGYFERTVISDEKLSESGRDKFLALSSEKGQELLGELDTFLMHLAPSDRSESGKQYGFGIYFFQEQHTDAATKQQNRKVHNDNSSNKTPAVEEIDVLAAKVRKE